MRMPIPARPASPLRRSWARAISGAPVWRAHPRGPCRRGRDEPRQQPQQQQEDDEGITFETSKSVKVYSSFDKMGLRDDLLRGVYAYGFEKPSAIQQRAIKPIVEGRDVIAQAQSGTGKTSMIAISVCQKLDTKLRE